MAKQHGYKGPDPNQPSDHDFTKQGKRFQSMIDNFKQGQQQQPPKETDDQSRERQRAAFLVKMKQTKDQLSQRQPGQDHGQAI